jgi:uncharacterized protein YjiS (DUF1127 family)
MRNSLQQQYAVRHTSAESFGRIARRTASATLVQLAAGRRSANEAYIASRGESEPTTSRALAASGFGDAAFARTVPERLIATQLEAAARTERSRLVGKLAAMAWRAVASRLKLMAARAQQRRQARATYLALRDLDARTLRDIGFDRSEILSVAAEFSGAADATRARVVLDLRGRYC